MKRESREWWPMPVILALQRLRHEGCYKFKVSLDYVAKPCLKKLKQNKIRTALNVLKEQQC